MSKKGLAYLGFAILVLVSGVVYAQDYTEDITYLADYFIADDKMEKGHRVTLNLGQRAKFNINNKLLLNLILFFK